MNSTFELNHTSLAADPRFAQVAQKLQTLGPIDSRESFNRYCQTACKLWSDANSGGVGTTSGLFENLLERVERGGPDVIQTPWGGVAIERHEPPAVEKYLVIRKAGYLALETHEEKVENLEVTEGAGIILSQEAKDGPLQVLPLAPGDRFHYEPGMVHCIIGTEDLLVFERSTDPKGMDQDLVFIYEPTVAA